MVRCTSHTRAFTLIELLVVISIIAILIGLLLPSLSYARRAAFSSKCRANMRSIAIAAEAYTQDNRGLLPPSYVYPTYPGGNRVDLLQQPPDKPWGYQHWSYYLFRAGAGEGSFTCPEITNGGLPRTNPGSDPNHSEPDQIDQNNRSCPNGFADKQAARMAFTANAALMPRNKFTEYYSRGPRVNVLVPPEIVPTPSKTILATEFNANWKTVARPGWRSWSHRPVSPFTTARGAGSELYRPPVNRLCYMYPVGSSSLLAAKHIENAPGLIQNTPNELNLVGRHHLGNYTSDGVDYGESSNFVYLDGHVETKNVMETIEQKEWGERFYSITGDNRIIGVSD